MIEVMNLEPLQIQFVLNCDSIASNSWQLICGNCEFDLNESKRAKG
jgi:hypothetical protein